MELKKTEEANIDRLRMPIILMGLLFTGSLVLASFSYSSAIEREGLSKGNARTAKKTFVQEVKKEEDTPPPPQNQVEAPPPVQEEILIEENTEEIPVAVVEVVPEVVIKEETVVVVEEEIIDFPDVEATFPGGAAALQKWIAENVQYPQTSIELNEQGKVYLSFVVEPDGSISNIVVERGVSTDLDREAKRLARSMPSWSPGEAKGKKSRTRCRLPINFSLSN